MNDVKKKLITGKKWLFLLVIVAAVAAAYLITAFYFRHHFLPKTTINGIECAGKNVDDVKQMIKDDVENYQLVLYERGGNRETVKGTELSLKVEFDESLDNLMDEQRSFAWPVSLKKSSTYEPEHLISFDEGAFQNVLAGLKCMDEMQMTSSQDAAIVFSPEEQKFEIQPAVFGTCMDPVVFSDRISDAVLKLKEEISLEDEKCYVDPVYTEDSEEVKTAYEKMNELLQADITYDMLDAGTIPISKEQMSQWLTTDDTMNVVFDDEAMDAFVSAFADQYNTLYRDHYLKTSWGDTVTISKGSYGWKLDQEAEKEALKKDILAEQSVTREPNYSRRASSHSENDYGNTYVEINLTAQHLYFYKNGEKVIDTDFVSGNVSKGNATPTGIYPITYTEKDAVLRGDDYETPVSFWMPFNGGVGMHDATWRSSFGGTIYKTGGSHGCINLPYNAAKTIFANIKKGDPVLVYTLPGTERATSKASEKKTDTRKEQENSSNDQTQSGSAEAGNDAGQGNSTESGIISTENGQPVQE